MKTDITEIKNRLHGRVSQVCERLFPAGKAKGNKFYVGDIDGTPGKSLVVDLNGPNVGVWGDFAMGTGGDIIDLWRLARRLGIRETINETREFVGLADPVFQRTAVQKFAEPTMPEANGTSYQSKIGYEYLRKRKISGLSLQKYLIEFEGRDIYFPFYHGNQIKLIKKREAVDQAKPCPTEKNCEPILFGWQAVDDDDRSIVICEGEIDALSLATYKQSGSKIPAALSVPFGGGSGGKQKWIENEFDNLDCYDPIYLCMDNDEPGEQAAQEIARRLGEHRVKIVQLPLKDANECLLQDVSPEQIEKCFLEALNLDPENLRRVMEFEERVLNLFHPREGEHIGYQLPYGMDRSRLLFRPGEVTIWSGSSGSGKSQLLSDCSVDWIRQGSRICMASLEMSPAQSLRRMVRQTVNTSSPTAQAVQDSLKWLDSGLLVFDLTGKQGIKNLLNVFQYAMAKYGCDQFVIDSLMRLGLETDDYNAQEQTMFEIVDWTIRSNVHVHLVAHSRKREDNRMQSLDDVKGAMEIGANAFNTVIVWRNRKLEDELLAADNDDLRQELVTRPGVIINVVKQRNGDWEGKIPLWFDQGSYRYRDSSSVLQQREYLVA